MISKLPFESFPTVPWLFVVIKSWSTRAKTSSLAHSHETSHFMELWHKRLGHLNANSMKILQSMVSGVDVQAVQNDMHSLACEECVQEKQTRRPFLTDEGTRATKIWVYVL